MALAAADGWPVRRCAAVATAHAAALVTAAAVFWASTSWKPARAIGSIQR